MIKHFHFKVDCFRLFLRTIQPKMPQKLSAKKKFRPNVIFFDLEATGFDRPIRPVQVSDGAAKLL